MNTPDAPAAPSPKKTSQQQFNWNTKAAQTQQGMNQTSQFGPYGSIRYSKNGDKVTTKLNPGSQQLFDTEQAKSNAIASGIDTTPLDLGPNATDAHLFDLGRARLDPLFQQRSDALDQKLAGQGLQPGSEAFNQAKTMLGQQQNDAYNQLLLGGHAQSVSDLTAMHNQPYQDLAHLSATGGGIQQPNPISTPQVQVGAPDYSGMMQNNYLAQLQQQQMEMQQQNALYGAIGGIAGTALGGWGSGGFKV